MKTIVISALALMALSAPAFAETSETADRTAAIGLCRAEVAAQTGLAPETIRLDQARVRGGNVRVDLDVWRDGRLQNVRCDVSRAERRIASITPTLQTASIAQ
jgi:hypothetical protein